MLEIKLTNPFHLNGRRVREACLIFGGGRPQLSLLLCAGVWIDWRVDTPCDLGRPGNSDAPSKCPGGRCQVPTETEEQERLREPPR